MAYYQQNEENPHHSEENENYGGVRQYYYQSRDNKEGYNQHQMQRQQQYYQQQHHPHSGGMQEHMTPGPHINPPAQIQSRGLVNPQSGQPQQVHPIQSNPRNYGSGVSQPGGPHQQMQIMPGAMERQSTSAGGSTPGHMSIALSSAVQNQPRRGMPPSQQPQPQHSAPMHNNGRPAYNGNQPAPQQQAHVLRVNSNQPQAGPQSGMGYQQLPTKGAPQVHHEGDTRTSPQFEGYGGFPPMPTMQQHQPQQGQNVQQMAASMRQQAQPVHGVPGVPQGHATAAGMNLSQHKKQRFFNIQSEEHFPSLPATRESDKDSESSNLLQQYMQQGSEGLRVQAPTQPQQRETVVSGEERKWQQKIDSDSSMGGAARGAQSQNRPAQKAGSDESALSAGPYGLLGLLDLIRSTDPGLNALTLGTDLTTLGLNLTSAESLYDTFTSPWASTLGEKMNDFLLPECYSMQPPLQPPITKIPFFTEESLFYIFHCIEMEGLQAAAARELFKREWLFHKTFKLWFQRVSSEAGQDHSQEYVFFDPSMWERVTKQNVVIENEDIMSKL